MPHSIASQYKLNAEKSSANVLLVHADMQDELLRLADVSLRKFKFQYLTGFSFFDDTTIVAWFNAQFYHTATLALDLVHNAVLKAFSGDDYSIRVQNAPLKYLPDNNTVPDFLKDIDSFGYSFTLMLGISMTILSASYISFYIKVRVM